MSQCVPSGGGRCLKTPIMVVDLTLALIDGAIAVAAFSQITRIHLCNPHVGWTRQKVFQLLIGCSNIGFMIFFASTLLANCSGWPFWFLGCGFILMACSQILHLAAFLLLLSFWVDLCHQASDDDEEEENSNYEVLLEKAMTKHGSPPADNRRKCCSFAATHIGSRQKIVAVVALVVFFLVASFATVMWIGDGKNPIGSLLLTTIYLDSFSSAVLLLGGALAFYGGLLSSKMRTVRSEMVSCEMWKVVSLAAVSLVCFSISAVLALVTNVPLQVLCAYQLDQGDSGTTSILLFLYYVIGSSVPSIFVLWVMREMPSSHTADRIIQSRVVTFVRDKSSLIKTSQCWTAATTSTNQVHKASPI